MNTLPTAKEFWYSKCKTDELKSPSDIMIEFAKLHVVQALKEASENAKIKYDQFDDMAAYVNHSSILNAYPLENIK